MEIYLVQHGEATTEAENPERPLTPRGRDDVRRVAGFIAKAGLRPAEIRHSGKRRAQETAALIAEALGLGERLAATPGLAPNDAVSPVADGLDRLVQPVMLVGHLPFLPRLAGRLLVGDENRPVVRFRNGGVVCLARDDAPAAGAPARWVVAWMVTPDLVPG